MTGLVCTGIQNLANGARCFSIRLKAPRSNALEPELLRQLQVALDGLMTSGCRYAVLSGGRNFSTGGDVSRFLNAAQTGEAIAYADKLVPLLQDCVLRMIEAPVIFAVAAQGAITGGSAGFLFASDISIVAPGTFVQPYYQQVGFAPDGGWTAVLPEKIGIQAANDWLLNDTRFYAEDLKRKGVVTGVSDTPQQAALDALTHLDIDVALTTKSLVWDTERRAQLSRRLSAEATAFSCLIGSSDTQSKMARFLDRTGGSAHV